MLRFGMTKTAKGEFYDEKKKKKWDAMFII